MAKDTRWTAAVRSLAALAIDQEFDNGYLRIYSAGSGRPANADTAITDQVLLAELRFAATAVASESGGVLTFAAIAGEDSALANGTAAFARALRADGTTAICDLSVGTADANVLLPTVSLTVGVAVNLSAMTVTIAATSAQ